MRRLLLLPFVAFALHVSGGAAHADHGDLSKPLCADIVDANTGYGFDHVVTSQITTNVASCKGITYSVVIEVDPGEFIIVSSRGDGSSTSTGRGQVILRSAAITTDNNDDGICVYVMTSKGGSAGANNLLDRFPDAGCTPIALGGAGGGSGHA
jgi:hypothetical protein